MKKLLPLLLLLSTAMTSQASAAGSLEFEFGNGGKAITPVPLGNPWDKTPVHMDEAPDGGIVLGGGTTVVRHLSSGELDPAFGRSGILTIALADMARFEIGDLGVDSTGRIVVFGTATRATPRDEANQGAVLRYLPSGEPDPSFGGGDGVVMTNFGLRSPESVSLGAIDQEDRVVLVTGTGQVASECGRPGPQDRHLVRLTVGGALDPSFGGGGVRRVTPLQEVDAISLDDSGGIVLAGSLPRPCSRGPELGVLRLRADGSRRRSFEFAGVMKLPGSVAAIALDRRDRLTILCKEKQSPRRRNEHFTKVVRLLPSGKLDPSFSEGGWIVYEFKGPNYRWSNLLVDPRTGRLLAVGTLIRPLPEKKQRDGLRFHRWFMAMPIPESGGDPGGFESEGWITYTRFTRHGDAAASDAMIDREGEMLIAGTAREPRQAPRGGFAVARFELWGAS
jgi:uncharacterized delta-60 repeat protein